MRVLVVDSSRADREQTLRLIPADAHTVEVANDAANALAILATTSYDVVLVESTMASGYDLVEKIRARESATHVYVIVTASRTTAGDVKSAFHAGADDFLRKPMARDELLARIEAPVRIRRWAAKALFGQHAELVSSATWASADASICAEISEMLGLSLSPLPAEHALDDATIIASIPLTLPAENAEVCLAVGVDERSAARLAERMLGSETPEIDAVDDMMREIANVAAGAFKRAATTEGHPFTTGLPARTDAASFRRANAIARRQWSGVTEGGLRVRFEIELRTRDTRRLRIGELHEGMVCAFDIRNPAGALLMRSGSRITESHLFGLRRALGEDVCVDVIEAA